MSTKDDISYKVVGKTNRKKLNLLNLNSVNALFYRKSSESVFNLNPDPNRVTSGAPISLKVTKLIFISNFLFLFSFK